MTVGISPLLQSHMWCRIPWYYASCIQWMQWPEYAWGKLAVYGDAAPDAWGFQPFHLKPCMQTYCTCNSMYSWWEVMHYMYCIGAGIVIMHLQMLDALLINSSTACMLDLVQFCNTSKMLILWQLCFPSLTRQNQYSCIIVSSDYAESVTGIIIFVLRHLKPQVYILR